jgi:CheB methylesterase
MPADGGAAFVVIQHLDPNHVSYMADLLAKCTEMTVVQAEDGMPVEANSVYTIPPNRFLTIRNNHLCLIEPVKYDGARMRIDFFFRSLAEDKREKAICVIFSGSGSDGTLGLREVRGAGGMTLVQQPETAQFDAMLRSDPLGIIMGFAEDLLSESDPTSPQYRSLAIIDEEPSAAQNSYEAFWNSPDPQALNVVRRTSQTRLEKARI